MRLGTNQEGQSAALVALLTPVLILAVAVVVDVGVNRIKSVDGTMKTVVPTLNELAELTVKGGVDRTGSGPDGRRDDDSTVIGRK